MTNFVGIVEDYIIMQTLSIQNAVVTKEVTKKVTSAESWMIFGCLIFVRIGKSIYFCCSAIFDLIYTHTFDSEKTVSCGFAVCSFFFIITDVFRIGVCLIGS